MPFNTRQTYAARHEYTASSSASGSSNVEVSGSSVSTVNGILRKTNGSSAAASSLSNMTNPNEVRHVDLLVFGYACKVFRDDAKARDIDQGKHLIPWMGDNNLKIDRYDVRGALYDLTPYEPPPGGYGNRLDYLTADEQRAEQLCEEERYLFLYNNEEDVITRQEEEFKRLQQETNGNSYSQVGFSYDQSQQIGPKREESSDSPTCDEVEQPFQLPFNFQVPEGMQLPETIKQHAIIEKTARFIASQGVQMEILLKAKQSNNVQFEFLSQNSILNPYYKYVINSIKDGTYPQHTESKEKNNKEIDNADTESTNVGAENVVAKAVVAVPVIKYKPSADCAYTQLISKIKGVPLSDLNDESSRQSLTPQPENTNDSPSLTPVLLQYNGATFVTEHDDNSNSNVSAAQSVGNSLNASQPKVEILKNSSALALAQNYASDSETEDEAAGDNAKEKTPPKLEFPLPPESLQNIIDKTAVYVIKNGRQFEETLRSKSVERFTFLLPDNEYYPYYLYKITGDPNAASKEQKKRKAKAVAEALLSKKGLTGEKMTSPAGPVSFSIKSKDETVANVVLQQPALPQEHSDEEDKPNSNDTNSSGQRHVPEHVQKAIKLVESQLMARNAQLAATLSLRQPPISNTNAAGSIKILPSRYENDKIPTKSTSSTLAAVSSNPNTSKSEAERNALFEQQQQQRHKELKKAEEKVKDKLAQIAREKLGGLISKEKQLQLERKRKAMAFLNQIKGASKTDDNAEADACSKLKSKNDDDDESNNSDNSDASVHSIPITYYGPNSDDELDEQIKHTILALTPPKHPQSILADKIKEPTQPKSITVNVSDDDEVELIGESRPSEVMRRKRKSRSRSREASLAKTKKYRHYRKRTPSTDSSLSSNNECDNEEDVHEGKEHSIRRSKSKSHKSKKSKVKKSSKSKKKSKKVSKSKSRTRSRSRSHSYHRQRKEKYRRDSRPHSYHQDDYHHSQHEGDRDQSKRSSYTPNRSNYSSHSRSHEDKRSRYDKK